MKLDRKQFLAALSTAADVADRKGTTPILANVLVSIPESGGIDVSATDLRTTVSTHMDADGADAAFTCSASELCSMIAGLDGETVAISVMTGKIGIASGDAKFTLATDNPKDFPELPTFDATAAIELDAAVFANAIMGTAYAALASRANLSGVWLDCNGDRLIACATNGQRLVYSKLAISCHKFEGLVDALAATKIAKIVDGLEKCSIVVDGSWIHVRCGQSTLSSKLVESEFIPYGQFVENGWAKKPSVVSRAGLLATVKRVMVVRSNDKDKATFGDLVISSGSIRISREGQNSKGEDSVKCAGGTDAAMCCDLRYLADAVEHMSTEDVELHADGELDPINLRSSSGEQIAVIMPVRK